eukprot:gene13565-4453_t
MLVLSRKLCNGQPAAGDQPTWKKQLIPGCSHSYVSLSSVKYEVIGTKETLSEAKDANGSEESTESTYDTRTSNGRNARTSFKYMGQKSNPGVPEGAKFRNYSSSDFQNASSLRKEFNSLLEQQDVNVTPVTAYQFIRNCGNKMSQEPPESRIALALEFWGKLKDKGVLLETTHYNALLSVYIQNRHQFSPLEFLADMQENKVQPDKFTYSLIVQAYCQDGDLSGALRVIDFMTKQEIPLSEAIYTSLITGYSKNNNMEGAHKIFETMREHNILPQVDSYTALIAGYASHGDMQGIDKVFEEMHEKGVRSNALLYMNMLDSFCRNGYSSLLPEGLKRIKHKAPVEMEMRYFLQRLITRGDYESAAILAKNNELWLTSDLLRQDEFTPLNLFVYRMARTQKSLNELIRAMKVLEAHGLTRTPLEDVLDLCHSRKATADAVQMLDLLKEAERPIKTHYVYPMLVQLAEKEDIDGIFELLNYMDKNSVKIDPFALDFAAKGFRNDKNGRIAKLMDIAKAKKVRLSWKAATESLDVVFNGNSIQAFIDILPRIQIGMVGTKEGVEKVTEFLIRTFDAEETPKAIIALDQKNLYRLGWVMSKILEQFNVDDEEKAKDAYRIFQALIKGNAVRGLNTYCYTVLLNTFFKNSMRDEFFEVVNIMKAQGIEPNEAQYFIMLKMSSLIGNSAAAQFCYDKLKGKQEPTEAQYNALLIAYGKDDGKGKSSDEPNFQYAKKVISLYEEMREHNYRPLGLSVSQTLVAYTSVGKYEEAEEVKKLFGLGVEYRKYSVYNEYIRMFAKQGKPEGNIDRVLELVKELKDFGLTPNRITYSEVVKTFLRRNEPHKALEVVEEIQDVERLPSTNILLSLVTDFFERTDVESCERAIALVRKRNIDEWAEQRLKHVLLMSYLKDNNFTAAKDIVNKVDFRLTQRLIMAALGGTYRDIEFLLKVKNFLKENSLNYFLMDLAILNSYIASNDADSALKLYEEKRETDSAMTTYFLTKLANFLTASGREVPFDQKTQVVKDEETFIDEVESNEQTEESLNTDTTLSQDQDILRSEKND